MSYDDITTTDERLSTTILTLPMWLLLFGGGAVSMGLGAAIVLVPPLVGGMSPAYPNPTDTLGFATLLVMTGAGLISGGPVVCLVRIWEAIYGWSRRFRAGGTRRERERDTPR
jgi:hypothetical protein